LLNATLRGDGVISEHQLRVGSVTEIDPRRETRKTMTDLTEETRAVNRVKRVREVQFEENLVRIVPVAGAPLPRNLQAHLRPKRHGHADLERAQVVPGLVPGGSAQGLGSETTEHLAHSNRPSRTILFRQSHKEGTAQPRGDAVVGLAPNEQVDDIA